MIAGKTMTFAVVMVLFAACAKKDETPQPTNPQGQQGAYGQAPYGQPPAQGAYGQAPYGQQPQQPPYGQQAPAPGGYTPQPSGAAPAPTAGAPATPGQMATPGPLALPCQNDQQCGLAHCNVQYQKCAYPCQSAVDCIQGAACNTVTGLCLPGQ